LVHYRNVRDAGFICENHFQHPDILHCIEVILEFCDDGIEIIPEFIIRVGAMPYTFNFVILCEGKKDAILFFGAIHG